MLLKAVAIGCGGGSSIRALDDIFEFKGVTDHDWRALECNRANDMTTNTLFKRTCPGDPEYGSWVKSLKPEVIIGKTFRRANELEEGQQDTAGAATTIAHTFISSQAHLLMLESIPYLLKSATWTDDLPPLLSTTGYCWKAVEMSAQQVGVPSTKREKIVACVRNHPSAEERLTRWKGRLTDMRTQPITLGEFIGREGSYFLNRKKGEQRIFSFEDPIVLLTRGHILGEKPPPSGYQPHPSDVTSLEDAQELHLTDFAKIATAFEDYIFPFTLNRSAIATLLVDSTPGGMMRAVVACLRATWILPKAPTIPPDWEQEGLSCAAFDIRDIRRDDRQIQPRPDHSAGGNSEGETEDASSSSNTPRIDTTPTYGATRSNVTPNICGTTSTDSNKETKRPGHTGAYITHSRDRHIGRDSS